MRVLVNYLKTECCRNVYESVARYGIIFWGAAAGVGEIFLLQKKTMRIMLGMSYRDSCRGVFRKNGILTIVGLYIMDSLKFLYKNRHRFESYANDRYPVRHRDLQYPIHRLSLTEKHPEYMCRKLFNHLPRQLRVFGSYRVYVRNIRKWLLELEPHSLNKYLERSTWNSVVFF